MIISIHIHTVNRGLLIKLIIVKTTYQKYPRNTINIQNESLIYTKIFPAKMSKTGQKSTKSIPKIITSICPHCGYF